MDNWIEEARNDKWNAIQTVLHEWRLTYLTMDFADNYLSSDALSGWIQDLECPIATCGTSIHSVVGLYSDGFRVFRFPVLRYT